VQRGGAGAVGHGRRTVGLGVPRGQRADGARVKDLPGNGAWADSGRGASVVGLQPFGQRVECSGGGESPPAHRVFGLFLEEKGLHGPG
jgi:hypothetical protein